MIVFIGINEWFLFWNINVYCIFIIGVLSMLVEFIIVFLYVFVSLYGFILVIDFYIFDIVI